MLKRNNKQQPSYATTPRRSCEFYNTKIRCCSRSSESCYDPSECSDYKMHLDFTPNEKVLLEHVRHGYKPTLCGNPRDELYRRKQEYVKIRNIYTNDIVFAKIRALEITADEVAGQELAKAVGCSSENIKKLKKEKPKRVERLNEGQKLSNAYSNRSPVISGLDLKYTPNEKALIRYIHQGYKSSFGHPKVKLERRYEKLSSMKSARSTCTDVKQMIIELEKSDDEEAGIEIEKAIAWFATPEGKETKEKIDRKNKETRKMIKKLEKSWPERMLNRVNRYQSEHPYQYLFLLLTWPISLSVYIAFKVFSVFFAITSLIDPTMRFLSGDIPGFLSPGDGKIDIHDERYSDSNNHYE